MQYEIQPDRFSFKASETLLGIETKRFTHTPEFSGGVWLQSLWNPFRDWNRWDSNEIKSEHNFKASETLLGIETKFLLAIAPHRSRFKASETLLGIETYLAIGIDKEQISASKPLKPF